MFRSSATHVANDGGRRILIGLRICNQAASGDGSARPQRLREHALRRLIDRRILDWRVLCRRLDPRLRQDLRVLWILRRNRWKTRGRWDVGPRIGDRNAGRDAHQVIARRPWITRTSTTAIARNSSRWMKPPIVYE